MQLIKNNHVLVLVKVFSPLCCASSENTRHDAIRPELLPKSTVVTEIKSSHLALGKERSWRVGKNWGEKTQKRI